KSSFATLQEPLPASIRVTWRDAARRHAHRTATSGRVRGPGVSLPRKGEERPMQPALSPSLQNEWSSPPFLACFAVSLWVSGFRDGASGGERCRRSRRTSFFIGSLMREHMPEDGRQPSHHGDPRDLRTAAALDPLIPPPEPGILFE